MLVIDHDARVFNGGRVILGVDPPRVLRLTSAGAAAVRQLLGGVPADTPARQALAHGLIDAGIAHRHPEPHNAADVTVIITVRERPAELGRSLASVGTARVLVVDDGCQNAEPVAAVCRRHGADLLRRDAAGGPAAARNSGLAQVSSEFLAVLDSDCIPEFGWLAAARGLH